MELSVYLFLHGKCEEAMRFYQSVLGGELHLQRFRDSPGHPDVADDWKDKIMHASLEGEGFELMASDGREGTAPVKESSIALTLANSDEARAREVFEKLSAGGTVTTPLEKMFWGALFGQFTDKYGFDWMINCATE
jgi:PhnB protein